MLFSSWMSTLLVAHCPLLNRTVQVRVWHLPDFMLVKVITVPNTAVSVGSWGHFLAVSSTSVQMFETSLAPERWRTIVVADYDVLEV